MIFPKGRHGQERSGSRALKNAAPHWALPFELNGNIFSVHCIIFRFELFVFDSYQSQSMLSLPIAQAKIEQNMQRLKALTEGLKLTEREFALLSVAVTEMCAAGLDPYSEQFVIQVALRNEL